MKKLLALLLCTGAIVGISQSVEAYGRYRRSQQAWRYSRLNLHSQHQPRQTQFRQTPQYNVWNDYRFTRGSGGTLTESNIYEYRYRFRGGQSREANWNALGRPYHQDQTRQVWRLKEGGTFELRYQGDRGYGYANFN